MIRKSAVLIILWLCWAGVLSGCVAVVVGAGVGAGTYTYIKGELKREYHASYAETMQACLGILHDLNQPVLEKTTNGEETTIKTERKDGTPQHIIVAISKPDWTEVSVRTGTVGYWKQDLSQQFHEFIAERLKR